MSQGHVENLPGLPKSPVSTQIHRSEKASPQRNILPTVLLSLMDGTLGHSQPVTRCHLNLDKESLEPCLSEAGKSGS